MVKSRDLPPGNRANIHELLEEEKNLAEPGSCNDYSSTSNIEWIRAALRVLLEAEVERQRSTSSYAG